MKFKKRKQFYESKQQAQAYRARMNAFQITFDEKIVDDDDHHYDQSRNIFLFSSFCVRVFVFVSLLSISMINRYIYIYIYMNKSILFKEYTN